MIKTQIIILVSILFLGVSCRNAAKCSGPDVNKGIIIESLNITCSPSEKNNIIVTSDSMYQQMFKENDSESLNCSLPSVDFTTKTLLGFYATGQCEVRFDKEVTKEPLNTRYLYKLTVNDCGICKSSSASYNWVIVPKLPLNWTVDFVLDTK